MARFTQRQVDSFRKDASLLLKDLHSPQFPVASQAAHRFTALPYVEDVVGLAVLAKRDKIRRKHAMQVVAIENGCDSWNDLLAGAGVTRASVDKLRGAFHQGHTDSDINRVCSRISQWCGVEIGCVWDFEDEWGPGGNSCLHSIHEEDGGILLGPLPDGLWEFLYEGVGDPAEFADAEVGTEREDGSPIHVEGRNYVWRQGPEFPDLDDEAGQE